VRSILIKKIYGFFLKIIDNWKIKKEIKNLKKKRTYIY